MSQYEILFARTIFQINQKLLDVYISEQQITKWFIKTPLCAQQENNHSKRITTVRE